MKRIFTCMVPMRDGTGIFTTIHLPDGDGPFPVILHRTLYSSVDSISPSNPFEDIGCAYVCQDVRASARSEGEWNPWIQEADDGEDCLKWIAAQSWCSGRIAMHGGSYCGATQVFAARSGNPALVGIVPQVTPCNYHESPKYVGGAFVLAQNIGWALSSLNTRCRIPLPEPVDTCKCSLTLPICDIDIAAGFEQRVGFWRDWMKHQAYDEYWKDFDFESFAGRIRCPMLVVGSWFDIYTQGSIDMWNLAVKHAASENARKFSRCIIGPWTHGGPWGELPGGDVPENAQEVVSQIERRFLKGVTSDPDSDPLPGEKPFTYFLFGRGEWRSTDVWPPANMKPVNLYLDADSPANTLFGGGRLTWETPGPESLPDVYIYDPHNPVPTTGGHFITIPNGSHDRTKTEERPDVCVYTSATLTRPVIIEGPVSLTLYASSSAPDTDFTAVLVDVFPDGSAFNLCSGIIRARYRNSMRSAELMTPGETYEFHIDMWSFANAFMPGHKIRLEVSSSDFPAFDRNLNTGKDPASDTEMRVAKQTLFHDAAHPSRLVLPVTES